MKETNKEKDLKIRNKLVEVMSLKPGKERILIKGIPKAWETKASEP